MFLFHHIFNLDNSAHGSLIRLAHVTLGIAWGVTFKLTLVERSDKLCDSGFIDIAGRQLLADIFT